jgi:Flp pilus assembly protein TadG
MTHSANRSESRRPARHRRRRGAVTPLVALMLVPFTGMVAFALDIAWIVQSRSDLQSAADAAALAGAEQLMNGFVQYNTPSQTGLATILSTAETSAKTYAKNFASYNTAGGVSSLTLKDADIEFGFTDASKNYTAAPTYAGFPNTIKVTMRLDSSANGALKLFFAPIFGMTSTNVRATAAATIYTANVNDFTSSGGNAPVLPMTLDMNAWNTFISNGKSSDGTTHTDSNGAPQLEVYPSPGLASGNFGMLSLDDSSNSASAISGWIGSGVGASDLSTLHSNHLLPAPGVTATVNTEWKGAPGFKASDLNDLTVGTSFLMPLFEPVVSTSGASYQATADSTGPAAGKSAGHGSNTYYDIVGFVAVQISQVDKSSDAYVQPAAMISPTFVYDLSTVAPAGTTSSLTTTFTTPKLTQ